VAEYDYDFSVPDPKDRRILELEAEVAKLREKVAVVEREFDNHNNHNCYKLNCDGIADLFWEKKK